MARTFPASGAEGHGREVAGSSRRVEQQGGVYQRKEDLYRWRRPTRPSRLQVVTGWDFSDPGTGGLEKVRNIGIMATSTRADHDDRADLRHGRNHKMARSTRAPRPWTDGQEKERGITIIRLPPRRFGVFPHNIIATPGTWTSPSRWSGAGVRDARRRLRRRCGSSRVRDGRRKPPGTRFPASPSSTRWTGRRGSSLGTVDARTARRRAVPVQLPIGQRSIPGVGDLIEMRSIT